MYALISSRTKDNADGQLVIPLDGTNGNGPTDSKGNQIGVGNAGMGGQCANHQIAIANGDNGGGTIAVLAIVTGKTVPEPVFEEDNITPLVIDLSVANEPLTRSVENNSLVSIVLEFAGLTGSDDVTGTITSGDD